VGDFDAEGHADFGLFTPPTTSTITNAIKPAATAAIGPTFTYVDPTGKSLAPVTIAGATANDIPMTVNYDVNAETDLALFGPDPAHAGQYRFLVLTAASGFNPPAAVEFNNNGSGYGNANSIPAMADYQGNGKADFAVFTPDGKGGMQYVYQTNQIQQGVTLDFATITDLPLDAPFSLLAKKVRGS
jgi:hypothetical protein